MDSIYRTKGAGYNSLVDRGNGLIKKEGYDMKRKPMPPVSLVYPEQIHKVQSIAELLRQLDDLMLRSSKKNLVEVERKIELIQNPQQN